MISNSQSAVNNLAVKSLELPNLHYVICVPAKGWVDQYTFFFAGKFFVAIAICSETDFDWVMQAYYAAKESGYGGDYLLALISFRDLKDFRQYSAKDPYDFVYWVSE